MQLDWRKLGAEFLGTMVLVVIAVGVATESFGFHLFGLSYSAGVVTTALAFGLVLVALVYAIGPISGCHVNPAVTLGFISSGRMKVQEGIAYMVAQFAGGIVGAYLLYWMFTTSPLYRKSVQGLGADGYGKQSHLLVSHGRRLPDRGGAHGDLRARRPLLHPQGGHSGRGRRGHRLRRS